MNATAHRVAKGSRLVLMLAPTECGAPENPGTGGPMMTETATEPSHTTIRTGPTASSRLELPVLPR